MKKVRASKKHHELEQMAILKPSAANCSAQPRPSPLVAAVTSAILSLILKSLFNFLFG
jgi:hypothetical protein